MMIRCGVFERDIYVKKSIILLDMTTAGEKGDKIQIGGPVNESNV